MNNSNFKEALLLRFFRFRNDSDNVAVYIQLMTICFTSLALLGTIYIFFLVTSLTFHHLVIDSRPDKIPKFVQKSILMESSSESDDYNFEELQEIQDFELTFNAVEEQDERMKNRKDGINYSKKTILLEKFMNDLAARREQKGGK